jgi:hypothetical protein
VQHKFEISELKRGLIFSNGIGWRDVVYHRQVALLKEFYLLSSLLASFAGSYLLHTSLLGVEGWRLDGHARDLLFSKALLVDPLHVLAYSVDVWLCGKSVFYGFHSLHIIEFVTVFRDASFRSTCSSSLFLYTGGA